MSHNATMFTADLPLIVTFETLFRLLPPWPPTPMHATLTISLADLANRPDPLPTTHRPAPAAEVARRKSRRFVRPVLIPSPRNNLAPRNRSSRLAHPED